VGDGAVIINRYMVMGRSRRILIETGTEAQAEETLELVSQVVALEDLDYIFVSHLDPDHGGGLKKLLAHAPRARLLGGMGNLAGGTLFFGLPAERMAVLWAGESIDLGGRRLRVEEPLLQDHATLWLHDEATATLFSIDAFGAMINGPATLDAAPGTEAYDQGFGLWHGFTFPALPLFDRARFSEGLKALRRRGLGAIAPVHGPLVRGASIDKALDLLARLPEAPPLEPVPLPPQWRLEG
jgi:flavorubredoxin